MSRKYLTPVILGLVVIGLAAYIFIFQRSEESDRELSPKASPWLLSDASMLNKISLENETGKITLEKDENGWWTITEPFPASADKDYIQLFVDEIAQSRNERIVDPDPPDLGIYDLENPRRTMTLSLMDQSKPRTFSFGRLNPSLDHIYAIEHGYPEVFLVSRGLNMYLDKNLDAFRLKILLLYPKEEITSLSVKVLDESIKQEFPRAISPVVIRQNTPQGFFDWNMLEPFQEKASYTEIEAFLWTLGMSSGYGVIDVPDNNYAPYGLDDPRVVINLKSTDGNLTTIAFGKYGEDKKYVYSRELSRPEVITYPYKTFMKLMDNDLRIKKLITGYRRDEFSRIEVEFPSKPENNYSLEPVRGTNKCTVVGHPDKPFLMRRVGWVIKNFQDTAFLTYIYKKPYDLSAMRLDPPRAIIRLIIGDAPVFQFAVGEPDDSEMTYVLDQLDDQAVLYQTDIIFQLPPDKSYFFSEQRNLKKQ